MLIKLGGHFLYNMTINDNASDRTALAADPLAHTI